MLNRKRNRLKDFDYSNDGYYFVTICTKNREEFFGKIENEKMILNEYGDIVEKCWFDLPNHYKNCVLDEFIIMPNHIHGIMIIDNYIVGNGLKPFQMENENVGNGLKPFLTENDCVENGLKPFPTGKNHGLSEIIRGFKTFSSKNININYGEKIFQWQKSFYDHIIRNENSLYNIRQYIVNNPLNWNDDENNIN